MELIRRMAQWCCIFHFYFHSIPTTCHMHENTIPAVVRLSSRARKFDSIVERNAYRDRREGKQQRRRKGYTRCQLFDIYVKYFSLFYARLSNSGIKLCIVLLNGWACDDNSSAKSNTNISHSIHPFERLVSSNQNVFRKHMHACMHACVSTKVFSIVCA